MESWRDLESVAIRHARRAALIVAVGGAVLAAATPLVAGLLGVRGWWLLVPAAVVLVAAGVLNSRIQLIERRERVQIALAEMREEDGQQL